MQIDIEKNNLPSLKKKRSHYSNTQDTMKQGLKICLPMLVWKGP